MFRITRQIGIDMGHRVPHHGSKCFNPHGHRYTIEAICGGELRETGEETGMVLDFGFLKEEMMRVIDGPFDHAFCIWQGDETMLKMFGLDNYVFGTLLSHDGVRELRTMEGFKVVVINEVPTSENLAAVWYKTLLPEVKARSKGQATLLHVKVWETPNCWAQYPS